MRGQDLLQNVPPGACGGLSCHTTTPASGCVTWETLRTSGPPECDWGRGSSPSGSPGRPTSSQL